MMSFTQVDYHLGLMIRLGAVELNATETRVRFAYSLKLILILLSTGMTVLQNKLVRDANMPKHVHIY